MKIAIKYLRPNPLRGEHPIDRKKIEAIKSSIRTTGFWDNLLVRKTESIEHGLRVDTFQIAYGHHRLAALKELITEQLIDENYELDLQVRRLDDSAMVRIMAASNPMSADSISDVIRYISSECRMAVEDITASDISAFVGCDWDERKIKRLMQNKINRKKS